mmetsp:Transcript_5015/g.7415  ORF Transcript_5015/g.7415 Transcript_5015/m.7415 type:complete len:794 (-) Transcript_5015:39-2420(-)
MPKLITATSPAPEPCASCQKINADLFACDELGEKGGRYCAQCMIGRKVGVFWPVDEQWYQGTVEEFNVITGEHKLRYKDGDTEWVKIADHTGGNAGGSRKKELSPKGKDSSRGGMEQKMNKNLKVEQQQRMSRESSASSGPAVSASVSVSAPDPPAAQSSQQAQAASSRDQQQQQIRTQQQSSTSTLNNNQQQQSQNRHNNLVVLDNVREAMGVGEREGDVEEQNFMMAGAGAGTSTGGGSLSSVFKMLEQSDNSMGSLDLDVFSSKSERVKSFTGSIEMSIDDDTDGTLPLRRDSLATERMSFREERAPSKMNNYLAKAMELFWQKCCCKNAPPQLSWSRVSSALVRHVPCFWIGCGRLETSATDRMILTRLNMLSAVFALWQLGVGIFIMIVFLSDNVAERVGAVSAQSKYREALSPNLWMVSGSLLLLSLVGLVLFITMVVTIPVIRRVNLVGAIRFMWVLYWLIPLQIFLVIALWDYHSVTEVWIKHWWATKSMAWFRKLYCAEGTSNRECAIAFNAPVEWCFENFGAIDCQAIREEAQSKMTRAAYLFIYTNVILGGVLVLILLLSLGLLEGIISAPIVQRSKEANIPLWLTFPAIGCFALGFILRYSPSSLLSNDQGSRIYWIGLSYIVSGTSFTVSALLGWFISAKTVLNIRDKKQKEIAVYLFIIVVILTIAAVASIFCASAIFSLVEEAITDDQRGVIACYVDAASSCSNCVCKLAIGSRGECDPFEFGPPCPEWTKSDVTRIVATQLKQSTSLSAIFAIYALAALRFGFMLRNSISKYEIDYV